MNLAYFHLGIIHGRCYFVSYSGLGFMWLCHHNIFKESKLWFGIVATTNHIQDFTNNKDCVNQGMTIGVIKPSKLKNIKKVSHKISHVEKMNVLSHNTATEYMTCFHFSSAYPTLKNCLKRASSNCPMTVRMTFEGLTNTLEFVCKDGREGR